MAKTQRTKLCGACGEVLSLSHFRGPAKRCRHCIADGKKEQPQFRAAAKKHDRQSKAITAGKKKSDLKGRNAEWAEQAKTGVKKDKPPNKSQHLAEVRAKRTNDLSKTAVNSVTLAKKELAGRKLAHDKLLYFIMRMFPAYQPGWVHNLICTKLETFSQDVIAKKAPRLMLFMPPRSGKSEIASKQFPAFHLGHAPEHEIIAASYGVSLPMGFSRKIKEMMQDTAYKNVFPTTSLNRNAMATEGWLTTKGGGYVPAGVGGSITGKGAHVLIVDDPVKDAEAADSETQRESAWDWYGSTARTRLAPGGGILVIQTRWHDDDLAGKLIRQMQEDLAEIDEELAEAKLEGASDDVIAKITEKYEEVEMWEIINLPALAEQDEFYDHKTGQITFKKEHAQCRPLRKIDEALHPARFDELALKKMRRTMSKRHWSALMQQNPVPDDGDIFTKDSFRTIHTRPKLEGHHIYIAWDLAIGQKQRNDWTVGLVGALNEQGFLIIYDMIRVKTDELAPLIVDTAKLYEQYLQVMGLEQGQIQMSIMPNLKALFDERKFYPVMTDKLKPVTDKVARARPAQGMAQHGKILLPSDQPWVETFLAELLRFPNGLHDDIVDALSWLCRMVEGQSLPQRKKVVKTKSWKDNLRKHVAVAANGGAMSA